MTEQINTESDIGIFSPEYRNIGHRRFDPNQPNSAVSSKRKPRWKITGKWWGVENTVTSKQPTFFYVNILVSITHLDQKKLVQFQNWSSFFRILMKVS